jgi:hypothetical protein
MSPRVEQLLTEFPGPVRVLRSRSKALRTLLGPLFLLLFLLISLVVESDWLPGSVQTIMSAIYGFCMGALVLVFAFQSLVMGRVRLGVLDQLFFGLMFWRPGVHSLPAWLQMSIVALAIFGIMFFLFLAALMLMPDAGSLVLDDEGLVIKGDFGASRRVRWSDASKFEVKRTSKYLGLWRASESVASGMVCDIAGTQATKHRKSGLVDTYELSPEALVMLMTRWRELALQH